MNVRMSSDYSCNGGILVVFDVYKNIYVFEFVVVF